MLVALKVLLFRRGISQAKLARESGIDPSRLSRLIHGEATARASERRRISNFLQVHESEIFLSIRRARWRKVCTAQSRKMPQ
jgi:transcriptional regulator with XRE-family HTH domain